MGITYLLDTNIVSEPEKPQRNQTVEANFRRYQTEICIASVSWHELLFGLHRLPSSKRKQRVDRYLNDVVFTNIPILAYDQAAAEWHAKERARLTNLGQTPAHYDAQIAAVAYVNDLILVTRNIKDFQRFDGLKIKNWFE